MELEQSSTPHTEQKTSQKSKKRKHTDSEQKASSKKRKHLDPSLDNGQDTPTPVSKLKTKKKTKSLPVQNAVQSPSSSPPMPATLPDSDHDTNEPEVTNGSHTIKTATPATNTTLAPPTSPFHTTTTSLLLPLPPIALSPTTALPSLLTTHLTPLLLTYYPPLHGIILGISNPTLSTRKPKPNHPPPVPTSTSSSTTILAHCSDADGLSYVWVTATFLLFEPRIGDELEGWVNVCSEGFIGLICYNYFQVAVGRARIPAGWKWVVPGEEGKGKGKRLKSRRRMKLQEEEDEGEEQVAAGAASQDTLVNGEAEAEMEKPDGYFLREDQTRVKGLIRFRVVDCEVVPGHDRESWSLQIEGTLLDRAEEETVLEQERQKVLRRQGKVVMR